MRVTTTTRETIAGVDIQLSAQEVLVLADFRDKIYSLMEDWVDINSPGKDMVYMTGALLSNMLTGVDVMSLEDAHHALFNTPEEVFLKIRTKVV